MLDLGDNRTKTIQYIKTKTIQYNAIQCNAMQYNAMQCNAMQCNTNTLEYILHLYNNSVQQPYP